MPRAITLSGRVSGTRRDAGLGAKGDEPDRFPLDQGVIAEYGDWELVSHTFDVRSDGSAILAVIVETKKQRNKGTTRAVDRARGRRPVTHLRTWK